MPRDKHNRTAGSRLREVAAFGLLLPVLAYRKLVSPFLAPRCRYYPTCSAYAVEALRTYGPVRGSILAAWRVVRCNPFSEGGFDAVADQRLFRRSSREHPCTCDEHHNREGVTA